jgi:aminomethyltransferase
MGSLSLEDPVRETVLHDVHVRMGARMVEFGGWHMPVLYSSIRDEHKAVRTAAGLFDLCHMGRLEIAGRAAVAFLEYVQTAKVADAAVGEARYALLCDESGRTLDDIVFYRLADRLLVVVNASNRDRDLAWMQRHLAEKRLDATLADRSEDLAMLAVQGPRSVEVLSRLSRDPIGELGYYHALEGAVGGAPAVIGRTGYTGEDGFELYFSREHAIRLWNEILEAGRPSGLLPIGLGARDTLRLEAAMPLYGHELTPETNPFEAGLGFAVKLKRDDFVGRAALAALKERPLSRRLVCIECEGRKIPREGCAVLDAAGKETIGKVTSGTFSPTFERPICMAYVAAAHAEPGTPLAVEVRGDALPGKVVKRPFYKRKD